MVALRAKELNDLHSSSEVGQLASKPDVMYPDRRVGDVNFPVCVTLEHVHLGLFKGSDLDRTLICRGMWFYRFASHRLLVT